VSGSEHKAATLCICTFAFGVVLRRLTQADLGALPVTIPSRLASLISVLRRSLWSIER